MHVRMCARVGARAHGRAVRVIFFPINVPGFGR